MKRQVNVARQRLNKRLSADIFKNLFGGFAKLGCVVLGMPFKPDACWLNALGWLAGPALLFQVFIKRALRCRQHF